MNIRPYTPADLNAVKEIWRRQSLGYDFPQLELAQPGQKVRQNPTYFIRLVGEQDGAIVQAAFAHLTAEIYFLLDPEAGTPQERHFWFMAMQDVGRELAWKPGGLEDLHCFLPPQIEKRFAKRMIAHGWQKVRWPGYVTELGEH